MARSIAARNLRLRGLRGQGFDEILTGMGWIAPARRAKISGVIRNKTKVEKKPGALAPWEPGGNCPSFELDDSARRIVVGTLVIAQKGFDDGARESGAEWFGHELQSAWERGEHQTRLRHREVARCGFDCELEGVRVRVNARLVAIFKESDGWGRERLRESAACCEARVSGLGLERSGSSQTRLACVAAGGDASQLVARALLGRALDEALRGFKQAPGFEAASAAASEGWSIEACLGLAALSGQEKSRRAL